MCGNGEETVSHFLGQYPAIAPLPGKCNTCKIVVLHYFSVNDVFDNHHINTIVNFATRTKHVIAPEELTNIKRSDLIPSLVLF